MPFAFLHVSFQKRIRAGIAEANWALVSAWGRQPLQERPEISGGLWLRLLQPLQLLGGQEARFQILFAMLNVRRRGLVE
jgi:hypothetical protein